MTPGRHRRRREWEALSPAQKQAHRDRVAADDAAFLQEMRAVLKYLVPIGIVAYVVYLVCR